MSFITYILFYKYFLKNEIIILFFFFIGLLNNTPAQNYYPVTNVLKPDYRNHINIPEYNSVLMPLDRQSTGTGVWTELNPKVPRVDYYGIYLKDQLNCFAVGEFGSIIKSTDGGQSWLDKSFATNKTLLRISGNQNIIFSVGVQGLVLRSTDFGENWDLIDLQAISNIWGVYTFNDSTCFICATDGKLYKTFDKGVNWQTLDIGYQLLYWDMQFINQVTGFISCSNGKILKTTDAGNTWEIKETGDLYSIYTVEILPNNNLVVAGQSGQIYYSTDFGNTFLPSNTPVYAITEDLGFANNNIGFAVGQVTGGDAVVKTTDGGLNWNIYNLVDYMTNLNVDFISDSVGFNVGMDLNIYKTEDTGESWSHSILNENLISVSLPSDTVGYILGWDNLYKIKNGEIIKVRRIGPNGQGKIYFITDQVGHLIGYNGFLYKTTNGGDDWIMTDSVLNYVFKNNIQFISETVGWYSNNTVLKKTSDGGNSWQQIYTGSNFESLFFLDSLNGWITSPNYIYKTTNGGNNWDNINTIYTFNSISFKDIDTGYAVNSFLYKTNDGGYNWQIVDGVTGKKIQLVDSSMIVVWKNDGDVFISKDNGINWQQYNLPDRNSIDFSDKNSGYLVGDMGLIYSYQDTTIVPVELINFEANANNEQILLKWSTASELNNSGFEIQMKIDNDWYNIGFVEGNGTTSNLNNYTFIDTNPAIGKNYYRLKQIDYNGSYSYSKIINIDFSQLNDFKLMGNYPNPFNSQTNIVFSLPNDGNVELKVFNVLGREVDKLSYKNLKAGINKVNYMMQGFSSGVYFYTITSKNKRLLGKIVLIK